MNHQPNVTPDTLSKGKCVPCEGGVDPLTPEEAAPYLSAVPEWKMEQRDSLRFISREFTRKNFLDAVEFIQQIAKIAEEENHHPDIHLTDYKQLRIELATHAIHGLSVNDFVLAAKIDEIQA